MARQSGKGIAFKIEGLGKLQKSLDALPAAVAKKAVRQSIREALKPLKRAVEEKAPVGKTLAIRRSVKLRAAKRARKGRIAAEVRIGQGDFKGPTFYAAFREFGHAIRRRNRGPVVAYVEGSHFMQRAYESAGPAARADAVRRIKAKVRDAIRTARAAGGR